MYLFQTVQFVQGLFVQSYDATIEDSYRKHFVVDGEDCRLEILDTAGTEQFSGMRDLYVRNGQGFILVYSVNDRESLEELREIRDTIVRIKQDINVPMVLVGNKTDLERVVPAAAGREMSKQFGCSLFETSAKLNENVSTVSSVKYEFLSCN
ncbi:unnamed protein product [Haemonchus placei]|uniref:Small monomeric GTPase n=1 Tax=Haemonchus placei TaxID=6290 RepID=A0A0N4WE43_HAEPC|nr:unnamed protein product [Haemonchus placei]